MSSKLRRQLLNTWMFRLYLIRHLPMGFFSGMRIERIDDKACTVRIRHRWIVKNPFKSMFWAVMGMGAEMSTGALLLTLTRDHPQPVRFILTAQSAQFYSKARGFVYFECSDGTLISETLEQLEVGQSIPVDLTASARSADGKELANFSFTWRLQRLNR